MKRSVLFPFLVTALFAGLLIVSGCGKQKQTASGPSSNQELFKGLILDFTSGSIAPGDPVRILFREAVADSSRIGKVLDNKSLSFEPQINGTLEWENQSTLIFRPDEMLYGQQVQAELDLGQWVGKDALRDIGEKVFRFSFATIPLDMNLVFEPLQLGRNSGGQIEASIKGRLLFNAPVDSQVVRQLFRVVTDSDQKPSVGWNHDPNQHGFTISGLTRKSTLQALTVSLEPPAFLGLSGEYEKRFLIPAIGDFKVLDVARNFENNREIIIGFSDLLDESQDLSGIVGLESTGQYPEFRIRGNQLNLIYRTDLEGEKELYIAKAVKSAEGKTLDKKYSEKLFFSAPKPAVRILGDGVITPETEKVVLPFEAINLNAVDVEISKVYESNMMQFLQYGNLNEEYLPQEVSEIIWQGRVELEGLVREGQASRWSRYGLDLMHFIRLEPGALYNVRIGFRKAYTQYPCPEDNERAFEEAGLDALPGMQEGEYRSIWQYWYNYENRSWSDREDPCKPMYYTADQFDQQNILASNLGIIAKYDDSKNLFAVVTDLRTGKPRNGVHIGVYSYQQQLIGEAQTDPEGFVEMEVGTKAFFLIARDGREAAYLKLTDYQSLSLSEFEVEGRRQAEGLDGTLFAERGVWRPGDTIYLHFVLRDPENEIPDDHPVSFKLLDPTGKEYLRQTSAQHTGPIYPFTCSTDPNARTGNWTARIELGPRIFTKTLKIETVKPNRLRIGMDLPAKDLIPGRSELDLDVQWLTGLPGSNLEVEVDALLKSAPTAFSGYESYRFDDVARKFTATEFTLFRDRLNDSGTASVDLKLQNNQLFPGKLNALFKVRAYEPSGEFSSNSFGATISPYGAYAGIDFPETSWGSKALETDRAYEIPVVSLDASGKALPNRKLSVGLYEAQWRWWWDDSGNEIAQFNSDQHLMAFRKFDVRTDAGGKASVELELEDYGAYLIRVCDQESGHCTGELFYAGSYGGGMETSREFAAMLRFNSDKKEYSIGDEVRLTVPAGKDAQVLITLETGGRVIRKEWVRSDEEILDHRFQATEEMFPNVYAHVVVIQGLENRLNDLPVRQYGVLNIDVTDSRRRLEPQISIPEVLRPEREFTVTVSEKQNREMYYTLAVVDEGLLDLTRFKTPDLFDRFFERRALLTRNWDNYDEVIASRPGMLDRIISVGGDDAVEITNDADKANRFVPVVRFAGPFHLKKGKKMSHKLDMPNYSGAVRVMVVAASEEAYGSAERSVPVKDDIMALITAPRVLSPGETIEVPVTVFVTEPSIREVEVKLQDEEGMLLQGDRAILLKFDQPGEKICYFSLKAKEEEGIGKLTVRASGKNAIASQSLEIRIENPNVYQKSVQRIALAEGQAQEFQIPLLGTEGTNHAVIEISRLPSLGIEDRIGYLLRYPYGCIEQTTSAVFPQMYLGNFMELSADRQNRIKLHIIQGIDRLRGFQLSDHSMSYWPGNRDRSDWGTVYAAHFLVEARMNGYNTSAVLPGLLDFLSSAARNFRIKAGNQDEATVIQQAYRTMVLARAGKPSFGAMNYLFKASKLPQQAKWFLSLAYSYAGKKDIARELLRDVKPVDPYPSASGTYGSHLRDYAVLLKAYDASGMSQQSADLLMRMIRIYQDQGYWNTQTLAWLLSVLGERMGSSGEEMDFRLDIAGKERVLKTDKPVYSLSLGEEEFSGKNLSITNQSARELFVTITVNGKPVMGDEGTTDARYLDFRVEYVDERGTPLDIGVLKMGTEFKAIVTIRKQGLSRNLDEMALNQVFPSGWEILNWRMEGGEQANRQLDYQDIRDDRVLSFFDLRYDPVTVEIPLHATYPGNYYLPQTFVEAMYDDDVYAKKAGKWVQVVR
jgi:uncharacterized protein YfaS (alpha-2-macroglobulin family)